MSKAKRKQKGGKGQARRRKQPPAENHAPELAAPDGPPPFVPAPFAVDVDAAEEAKRNARYERNKADEFVVTALIAENVSHETIARAINRPWGVKVETLKRHYARELLTGKVDLLANAHLRVAATMANPAHRDSTKAAMFMVGRLGAQVAAKQTAMQAKATIPLGEEGDIEFTLNIGEHEPKDADDIDDDEYSTAA